MKEEVLIVVSSHTLISHMSGQILVCSTAEGVTLKWDLQDRCQSTAAGVEAGQWLERNAGNRVRVNVIWWDQLGNLLVFVSAVSDISTHPQSVESGTWSEI